MHRGFWRSGTCRASLGSFQSGRRWLSPRPNQARYAPRSPQRNRRSSRTVDHGTRWRPVSQCRTVCSETPRYAAQALRLRAQLWRNSRKSVGRRTSGVRGGVWSCSSSGSVILHNIHYAKSRKVRRRLWLISPEGFRELGRSGATGWCPPAGSITNATCATCG